MPNYTPDSHGKCPHCLTGVRFVGPEDPQVGEDIETTYTYEGYKYSIEVGIAECPSCNEFIITYKKETDLDFQLLYPLSNQRHIPPEVPSDITVLYREASSILYLSPRASAALSRTCLERILSDPQTGKSTKTNLVDMIKEVSKSMPEELAGELNAVREIGNFAVHSRKSTATSEVIEVGDSEAEWNLDVLDALFDYYYVQPARRLARKDALNKKLKDAGKKEI